jgi:hypothetical protein
MLTRLALSQMLFPSTAVTLESDDAVRYYARSYLIASHRPAQPRHRR